MIRIRTQDRFDAGILIDGIISYFKTEEHKYVLILLS